MQAAPHLGHVHLRDELVQRGDQAAPAVLQLLCRRDGEHLKSRHHMEAGFAALSSRSQLHEQSRRYMDSAVKSTQAVTHHAAGRHTSMLRPCVYGTTSASSSARNSSFAAPRLVITSCKSSTY